MAETEPGIDIVKILGNRSAARILEIGCDQSQNLSDMSIEQGIEFLSLLAAASFEDRDRRQVQPQMIDRIPIISNQDFGQSGQHGGNRLHSRFERRDSLGFFAGIENPLPIGQGLQ